MLKAYAQPINLTIDNAHTRVIRLVPSGARVLELGCWVGHMTRVLQAQGCSVTGVEIHADAAAQAAETGARVVVADLDTLDWDATFGSERFDVVLAADVLEHLRDPVGVLKAACARLTDAGVVISSIPNIAHASIVAELLQGRFSYQSTGLLDDSHIRFFTRDSIYQTFEDAGLEIATLERIIVRPEETEFHSDLSSLAPEVVAFLESREEATTYQFVVSARPAASNRTSGSRRAAPADPETASPAQTSEHQDGFMQAVAARWSFIENERQHAAALIGTLGQQLIKSEAHINWLTSERVRLEAELEQHTTASAAQIDQLQIELAHRLEKHDELVHAYAVRERELAALQRAHTDDAVEARRTYDALAHRLLKERGRFAETLEITQQERDTRAEQAQVLEAEAEALRDALGTRAGQVAELEDQARALYGHLATRQAQVTELEDQIRALYGHLATRQVQVTELETHVTALQSHVTALQAQVAQSTREAESLQEQVANLHAHVAEMTDSTSWKVTRPLRWTKGLLRRIAGKGPA